MKPIARPSRPSNPLALLALLAALLGSALLSACSITITAPAHDDSNSAARMRLSKPGSVRFECVKSPSGECHYALYTTRCQSSSSGEGGKPATTCTHQVFDEFTLTEGQTRELRELPDNYKQCMRVKGKPTVPHCD